MKCSENDSFSRISGLDLPSVKKSDKGLSIGSSKILKYSRAKVLKVQLRANVLKTLVQTVCPATSCLFFLSPKFGGVKFLPFYQNNRASKILFSSFSNIFLIFVCMKNNFKSDWNVLCRLYLYEFWIIDSFSASVWLSNTKLKSDICHHTLSVPHRRPYRVYQNWWLWDFFFQKQHFYIDRSGDAELAKTDFKKRPFTLSFLDRLISSQKTVHFRSFYRKLSQCSKDHPVLTPYFTVNFRRAST